MAKPFAWRDLLKVGAGAVLGYLSQYVPDLFKILL